MIFTLAACRHSNNRHGIDCLPCQADVRHLHVLKQARTRRFTLAMTDLGHALALITSVGHGPAGSLVAVAEGRTNLGS